MTGQEMVGEILLRAGVLGAAGLAQARALLATEGGSLGRVLATLGLADEETVAATLAREEKLDYMGADHVEVEAGIASLLPVEFSRKHLIAPLGIQGRSLRLAMVDPLDLITIQDVQFRTNKQVLPVVASESAILGLLDREQRKTSETQKTFDLLTGVRPLGEVEGTTEIEYEVPDPAKLARDTKLPPIVRLVNLILSEAAKSGASDIHIEPQETFLQVRQRVDGILHDVLTIPRDLQDSTISRLKVISGMDIAERRRPQDGRSRLKFEGRRIDLRVSTLPTQFGEKVVIRLLHSDRALVHLDNLGLSGDIQRDLQLLLTRPQGMILVTGPTGSGKTSTLYAAINWLKSSEKNIITVEDPIEFQLPGINQVQINTRAGVTFAAGLRSILRQDPNIVLVGEIRDQETAAIALEAAQTGHLILSTVHTNDAPSTITRLLDLGIEPFLVASSLTGVLAQRLVRRPCPSCAVAGMPAADIIEKLGGAEHLPADARWVAGKGCEGCRQTGYKGRTAIHELLLINDAVRELITRRAPDHAIREAGRKSGMRTMIEDAIVKAAQGITTLEEISRVVPADETQRSEPAREAEEGSEVRAGASGGERPGKATGKILVVEDSPTVASVVKYFLELEGYEVFVAEDGIAGLEIARRERPAVVVSDVKMPGMDGLALVKALRSDPATRDTGILMLTSEASVESETEGLAVGADDYIIKPVEPRRLVARVRTLLARSQVKQAVGS